MSKIAFVFPGQGSQYSGMGKDYADIFPAAKETFAEADEVLGEKLSQTIFTGSKSELQRTENTQPAILTVSVAIARVLEQMEVLPQAVAGLSLGEYSALVTAGALKFREALPLVRRRGKYMQEAVPEGKGTMAAVMKLERYQVEAICRQARCSGVVEPANYNCPGQIVIAGERPAVEKVTLLVKAAGGRAKELPVSSCFHCSLQKPVEELIREELKQITISAPAVPVVVNCSADYVTTPGQIQDALVTQVSHSVYWQDSIQRLINDGFDTFVEVGPGKSVSTMIGKIDPRVLTFPVGTIAGMEQLMKYIEGRWEAWI